MYIMISSIGVISCVCIYREIYLKRQLKTAKSQCKDLEKRLAQKEADYDKLTLTLDHQKELFEERISAIQMAKEQLSEKFESLSLSALSKNNQQFLDLAKKTFEQFHQTSKNDLDKKHQSFEHLVSPLKESLKKLDDEVKQLEKERRGEREALKEQIKMLSESEQQLQKETANLVKALRLPDVRGKWGEMQLKRVVEMAGMINFCDFVEQQSYKEDNKDMRPDMIIKLPAGREVIIDAKAPFTAFLDANQEKDEDAKWELLQKHAKHLKHHIQALGKKSYWKYVERTPEFVILFLPAETFFHAALQADPSLIELSAQHNIVLATPSSLIGLLKAIAFGWKEQRLSQSYQEVAKIGQELYKRLYDMNKHLSSLGKSINNVVDHYNKSIGSFETRVLSSARKFQELGAASKEIAIDENNQVEKHTRALKNVHIDTDEVMIDN